jgi:hypothetical protein
MKIKLRWQQTNDELLFDIINQDMACWFVETSQQLGNQYAIGDQATDIPLRRHNTDQLMCELDQHVDRVNEFLIRMKQTFLISKPTNWYDQKQLNKLHKDWAATRRQWPKLPNMLYKLDPTLFDCYQKLNCHIHLIERSFYYRFRDPSNWRVDNIFKNNIFPWEVCHLSIEYAGHGRHSFEKFEYLDEDLSDIEIDNCNWDNIDAWIGVNLTRPYVLTPPEEFLNWCQDKNLVPNNYTIPLANLSDWRNTLTEARTVFAKNIKMQDNYFTLEIIN